jgi:hypothetical protein
MGLVHKIHLWCHKQILEIINYCYLLLIIFWYYIGATVTLLIFLGGAEDATALQCYSATALQCYSATVLQCYSATVLQCYSATVPQCYLSSWWIYFVNISRLAYLLGGRGMGASAAFYFYYVFHQIKLLL